MVFNNDFDLLLLFQVLCMCVPEKQKYLFSKPMRLINEMLSYSVQFNGLIYYIA